MGHKSNMSSEIPLYYRCVRGSASNTFRWLKSATELCSGPVI